MKDIEYAVKMVLENLEQGLPAVIASIVSLRGSSPRHVGTKMVIGEDGKCFGTIGGSLLEASAIQAARAALQRKTSRLMNFDLDSQGAEAPGMICGGQARMLLEYIPANPENQEFFRNWLAILTCGRNHYLLTGIKQNEDAVQIVGHSILFSNGQVYDNFLAPEEFQSVAGEIRHITETSILRAGDIQVIVDPLRQVKTVYLFGAGHVSVPTAKIAAMTGFRVVVIDDRAEFASAERFPEVHELRVIESFKKAFGGLDIDAHSFIVIVTRGHQFDQAVLESALLTGAGYIGMISSRQKRDTIYQALLAKGIQPAQLEKVHSPIGLPIGGETPEEIAVSIVAELIRERSKQQADR